MNPNPALVKLLAAVVASSTVVTMVKDLPSPWNQVGAALVALVGTYVNWASHRGQVPVATVPPPVEPAPPAEAP